MKSLKDTRKKYPKGCFLFWALLVLEESEESKSEVDQDADDNCGEDVRKQGQKHAEAGADNRLGKVGPHPRDHRIHRESSCL